MPSNCSLPLSQAAPGISAGGIAVSRKNFLFLGSDRGGERAAAIFTIIESAKLNNLNPEAYLATVLDRMARGHPINRLDELLPWNFQPVLAAAA